MSTPFNPEVGPQPPKVLKAPLEIFANLRQLQSSHDPLLITFHERNLRFQSYLVEIDRERGVIALDEMIPNDGERFLKNGESFAVEAFHEGVRIAWESQHAVEFGELDGARCYWSPLPAEILYHQRRNAYRAILAPNQLLKISLAGDKLKAPLAGEMLDISATGCKLRFPGDLSRLHTGQVYERLTANLPLGAITTSVELRHVHYDEKLETSFVGMRFFKINGQEQRQIDRLVYQLQREARREND